jgi:hypothetical protein
MAEKQSNEEENRQINEEMRIRNKKKNRWYRQLYNIHAISHNHTKVLSVGTDKAFQCCVNHYEIYDHMCRVKSDKRKRS